MERLLSQNSSIASGLLVSAWQGFFALTLLFFLCLFGVHAALFMIRGWRLYDGTQSAPPDKKGTATTEEKAQKGQTAPEHIYYIVEKKRRRSQANYGEPKQIRFK